MKSKLVLSLILLLTAMQAVAQLSIGGTRPVYDSNSKTYLLTVPETVFGGAYQAPVVIDDGVTEVKIDGRDITDVVDFPVIKADTSYTFVFKNKNQLTQSSINFTFLPIISITGQFFNNYKEAPIDIIFPDGQGAQSYKVRIKRAGASTNAQWIHKRNYHIKFIDDNGDKMDVSFFGLRNDNHWRLDAGTRDMIRFRNYAANGLWADFGTKSYYADREPKARSYIRGSHVEVFMNGAYHGFYNLSEFLDRKQMKLKKYSEEEVVDEDTGESQLQTQLHGLMWKATTCSVQTLFVGVGATAPNNNLGSWGGWELEYPEIDDVSPTDYSVLRSAVRFVASSNDADFARDVWDYFDLPVLADYYMFINVVFAIDNAGNNLVLACYDSAEDKKLTLAVWDLDATVGQHFSDEEGYYHADVIQPENELEDVPATMCALSNNKLFMRVKNLPEFKRMVVNRYWQLRETILQPDSLVARYKAIFDRLDACGALDREAARWYDINDIAHRYLEFDEEFDYLCDWLRRRIAYLDTHTFACLRGDVDSNGKTDIADVTELINYLLTERPTASFNDVNADVDANNIINIDDVAALISILLMS